MNSPFEIKKILHLSQTDISCDPRILKSMTAASKVGCTVEALGISDHGYSDVIRENTDTGIKSIKLLSKRFKFLPKIIRVLLMGAETTISMVYYGIRCKPKIIHCNDITPLLASIIIKLFCRSKIVYDAHELESNRSGTSKTISKLIFLIESIFWKYIDFLIVVSPSIERWYLSNLGFKESAVILNVPTQVQNFDKKNDYLRNYFGISKGRNIFIYNGNLCEGRGIDVILETFGNSKCDGDVVFLGFGPYLERINDLSKDISNIHLHPAVPYSQVLQITQSADVGLCLLENVSLSDYYSLPNKLFEYLHSGIRVVASNFPDISEILSVNGRGNCIELSPENLHDLVKELEQSKEIYNYEPETMQEYSWPTQKEKLMKIYEGLI